MIDRGIYINKLSENLVALRKMLGLTQLELSLRLGISRYKLICFEKNERKISWTTYLAFVMFYYQFEETRLMLYALGIFTDEVKNYLIGK